MSNPNNCAACKYKQMPDGGWCYMFRHPPTDICMQHTMRNEMTVGEMLADLRAMQLRRQAAQRTPRVCVPSIRHLRIENTSEVLAIDATPATVTTPSPD